jgi:beta-aspartyl-peptidase (threonine type)
MNLALIVHGGAHAVPPEKVEVTKVGCTEAARVGWSVLNAGGSALDAVEAAIRTLEDDPTFNAGYGSELNTEGQAQMDAALMDGTTLNAGAVGAIQGVRHPVSVARKGAGGGTGPARRRGRAPLRRRARRGPNSATRRDGQRGTTPRVGTGAAEKDRKKRGPRHVGCVALDSTAAWPPERPRAARTPTSPAGSATRRSSAAVCTRQHARGVLDDR